MVGLLSAKSSRSTMAALRCSTLLNASIELRTAPPSDMRATCMLLSIERGPRCVQCSPMQLRPTTFEDQHVLPDAYPRSLGGRAM